LQTRGLTLLVRMRSIAKFASARSDLAGALPSPEDELAEVRVSQVSLLPGQDSYSNNIIFDFT